MSDRSGGRFRLFDIRNVIGGLMVVYGAILLVASFGTSEAQRAKADGANANLWVGLVLLVFGILMLVWAVVRPLEVDEDQIEADKRAVEEEAERRRGEGTPA